MIKPEIYRSLGLSDQEYQKILKILGREPTSTELAMFSVEWSEHCGYPRSRNWLKLLPKKGKYQSLIGEDSGGIIVDDLAIIFKMESHNHPSQIEPKQGAATGVGGIIRDIFTAGARPIASLNSLRFGPLSEPYNRYLLGGVVDGIQFYGNCIGIPTVGGEIYFDESYSGNCLVNAMCIGVANKDKLARAVALGAGNSILYVGSSTGRDGIGGCSVLASHEFKKGEEKRPTVQIGDPFMEKCLVEATLEALATGYIVGIKDMGAAGLTCSVSEMASAGNCGVEIELQLVPRADANMEPWEVMMSESQERMLICARKGKEKEIQEIFLKWDLHAVVIGKVTDNGMVCVKDKGKIVAEVSAHSLTEAPVYDMPYEKPDYLDELNKLDVTKLYEPKDYNEVLLKLLNCPTICNKAWVYEQYDHMVQTNTIILPGMSAAVIRLKGTNKAIAATTDCNSRFCYLNPYRGAQMAVAEAARNLVCSGAEPAAVTDCLNFGNPEKPDRFWYFKNCVEGIADTCKFFNIPVISGNVSFYNESPKGAIYPTPTIGMIGIIEDTGKICRQHFKKESDVIILLGSLKQGLGGSEYLKEIHGLTRGDVPDLDLQLEQSVQAAVLQAIRKGLVNSAHDCSEGGLAVTIAEACITEENQMLGAVIKLDVLENFCLRMDEILFAEAPSRIVVSVNKDNLSALCEIAKKHSVGCQILGEVKGDRLIARYKEKTIIDLSLVKLSDSWRKAIPQRLAK
ncbi:MAG: phosphoribosylformylglycinamidine synthase subunit PurL [Candidatus Omnitrophica bacterium]|nr:phosphoribosylformylglycinamidine synthase subunit PurL [Candidatus Omnitrophota bacterium]